MKVTTPQSLPAGVWSLAGISVSTAAVRNASSLGVKTSRASAAGGGALDGAGAGLSPVAADASGALPARLAAATPPIALAPLRKLRRSIGSWAMAFLQFGRALVLGFYLSRGEAYGRGFAAVNRSPFVTRITPACEIRVKRRERRVIFPPGNDRRIGRKHPCLDQPRIAVSLCWPAFSLSAPPVRRPSLPTQHMAKPSSRTAHPAITTSRAHSARASTASTAARPATSTISAIPMR